MAEEKKTHEGHRQRMRKRVEQQGFDSLEPHEGWNTCCTSPTRGKIRTNWPMTSWAGSAILPGCWKPPKKTC